MEDRDDDKLSSSLPETLHAHIIRPDDSDGHSDGASSNAQDRRPAQRQTSRPAPQFTSSLTPATFPNSLGSRGASSHDGLNSPGAEDGVKGTQRIPRTSAGQGGSAPARSTHPPRAILIPYDHRSPGNSGPPFYQYTSHSYTFPPPPPSQFYVSPPGAPEWPEGGAGPSSLSHRARRTGSGSRPPEGYREGDSDHDFGGTREVTYLSRTQEPQQSRPGPEPLPPFYARDVTRSRENSPNPYSAPHSYDDPRYLQPPSDSTRRNSLPSQPWDHRNRSWSSSSRQAPGILLDDPPTQRASSYCLPPVSALLTPLRREYYNNRGPQLPRLVLPDEPPEIPPTEVSIEEKESSSEKPTDSVNASVRGKRTRSDTREPDERKTKVARKIYVACHFCRGRKLRCDGAKPSCANCSTRTLECVYEAHPRRRGPGKAPKGSRTKKSEVKGPKGRKAKAATSEADREFGSEQAPSAAPDRHVLEPPMMLPGHGHPHLSELEAVYAPLAYADRLDASNTDREGPESTPRYRYTGNVFEHRPGLGEGQPPSFGEWRQDGDEEDGGSLDSGYALPPGSQKDDTDEELTNQKRGDDAPWTLTDDRD